LRLIVTDLKKGFDRMSNLETIKREFLRLGFLNSPLSSDELKTLEGMGFCADDIFNIGCDMALAQFDTIDDAAAWYIEDNEKLKELTQ